MPFKKGQSGNPAGRPAGSANRLTTAAREAFGFAFEEIGGKKALARWAKKNPDKFYPLFAKLIPVEVASVGEMLLRVVYDDKPPNEG
jgi:hypothetical protein